MVVNERRLYQRSKINGAAQISPDGRNWEPAAIGDMSSSGIQLTCDSEFKVTAKVRLKLTLYGLASEFEVTADGIIRHGVSAKHNYVYGVELIGLSPDTKIRIDEMLIQMRPKNMIL